jgi:hypothetical protein
MVPKIKSKCVHIEGRPALYWLPKIAQSTRWKICARSARFQSLVCHERFNGKTSDQRIAEHEEFQIHRDVSRFFKRISMGYPDHADSNEGLPYLSASKTPKGLFIESKGQCKI